MFADFSPHGLLLAATTFGPTFIAALLAFLRSQVSEPGGRRQDEIEIAGN